MQSHLNEEIEERKHYKKVDVGPVFCDFDPIRSIAHVISRALKADLPVGLFHGIPTAAPRHGSLL